MIIFWCPAGVYKLVLFILPIILQPVGTQVLRDNIGSAIRPKNSRPVAPPGFMLHAAADFSGLDVQIFYNLDSYDSPESPL